MQVTEAEQYILSIVEAIAQPQKCNADDFFQSYVDQPKDSVNEQAIVVTHTRALRRVAHGIKELDIAEWVSDNLNAFGIRLTTFSGRGFGPSHQQPFCGNDKSVFQYQLGGYTAV